MPLTLAKSSSSTVLGACCSAGDLGLVGDVLEELTIGEEVCGVGPLPPKRASRE